MTKAGNTSRADGGSRFASLVNLTKEEGDNEGGFNVDENGAAGANQGQNPSEADRKGKKPVGKRGDPMDGVELCASDPSLLNGMRVASRTMAKKEIGSKSYVAVGSKSGF